MNLLGLEITRRRPVKAAGDGISLDTLIRRLEAAYETLSGIAVTPDTAMQAPTVQAIVTAVSRRIAASPVHVFRKTTVAGRERKERLPNHPVERLLNQPNDWQTRVNYWHDAASWLLRYGRFYAFKARGQTGPIRRLEPLHPAAVDIEQDDETLAVSFRVRRSAGAERVYRADQIHHVRGAARDGLTGDSPIMDVREAIALEIAAEKYGAAFFGNGAMPSLVFQYVAQSMGHKTDEERKAFIDDFVESYGGRGRFKAMLLPKGIELADPIAVDNEKSQFIELRQYQRTVIAGAFGVPPHLTGDLTKMTFGNVEQQSLDFVINVVLPYARIFEAAMERDLLTPSDRNGGVIIRFNLDGALRGDFKSRQEGLKIQREMGVISPNDWREHEGMNPIAEADGGEAYWQQGPSGQSGASAPSENDETDDDDGEDADDEA